MIATRLLQHKNKVISHFFVLLYSLTCLFIWPQMGDGIREPKWIFLRYSCLLAILCLVLQKEAQSRFWALVKRTLPCFWIFSLYAILQSFSLTDKKYAVEFSLNYLALVAVCFCFLSQKDPLQLLEKSLLLVAILSLLFVLLQALNIDPFFAPMPYMTTWEPVGFLGHPTLLAALMAMLSWWFYSLSSGQFYKWPLFILCSLVCFLPLSIFGIFSWCIGGLLALSYKGYRTIIYISLAAIPLFILLSLLYGESIPVLSDSGRFNAWWQITRESILTPWFGHGMNSFAYEFSAYNRATGTHPWQQAHNEPLELFYDGGIVGLLLISFCLAKIPRAIAASKSKPGYSFLFICLFANALGNFTFHIAPFALYGLTAYLSMANRPTLQHKEI